MRRLYHFPLSPYSRRARLVLRHKKLDVELVDSREDPATREAMQRLYAMRTAPVLVEDDGSVIGDSGAIADYVDHAYSGPPLWPSGPLDVLRVSQAMALTDGALATLIDMGTRYYALREHASWPTVTGSLLGRANGALEALSALVSELPHPTIAASGWSIGDIWLGSAVAWLEGLPARAHTYAPVAQVVSLGWRLPEPLSRWATFYREHPDVRSL
jgi:glutathione S-transferase